MVANGRPKADIANISQCHFREADRTSLA